MSYPPAQALSPRPLDSAAIRARNRPGGVLAFWALKLLVAWILAAPLAGALGGTGIARFPGGDARLFAPGGMYLMDALRLGLGSLAEGFQNTIWFALFLGYLCLLPLAGLLYALCHGGRLRPGDVAREAFEQFPRFTLLAGLTLLVQAAIALAGVLVLSILHAHIYQSLDVRRADLTLLGVTGVFVVVALGAGLLQDLARAALVRHGGGLRDALHSALHTAKAGPLAALGAWLVPCIWSIAAVAVGALVVGRLHVERSGTARVLAVLGVHQLVALSLVALKAQWLAAALRLVGTPAEEPGAFVSGGGGGAERLAEDLQVAPRRTVPAEVEAHHAAPELAPGGRDARRE